MDTLVNDTRTYIFALATAAGRIACCSVSHRWYGYAIATSVLLCRRGMMYTNPDIAFTADELTAMFADFHLLCRIKPRFRISTYTICAGGSVQAATWSMICNRALAMLNSPDSPDSQLVLDPHAYTDVMNGAARSGSMEMIQFAMMLVPVSDHVLCQDIRWDTNDIVRGGNHIISWWLSTIEPKPVNYANIFTSACAYASLDTISYVHELCLAAAMLFTNDQTTPEAELTRFGDDFPDIMTCGSINTAIPSTPKVIPSVNIELFLSVVGMPRIEPTRVVTVNDLGYKCHPRPTHPNPRFDLHTIFSSGVVVAIKHQHVDAMKLASSFTKGYKADPQMQHRRSMMVASILGELDDVDFLDELIESGIEVGESTPPYSLLLLLVTVSCPRLVAHLLAKIGDDSRTQVIFERVNAQVPPNERSTDYIDLLLYSASQSGHAKNVDVLIKFKQPTLQQLNKYMSVWCRTQGHIDTNALHRHGATMCECGRTHS